jgi:hypothetical protein
MPQLETLVIVFLLPVPNRDVRGQLIHLPITTHDTLPDLRWFVFNGVSAYMEAVVHRITTPRLESVSIDFFKQLTHSVPRLLQFMNTTEIPRFASADFIFSGDEAEVMIYPRVRDNVYALSITVKCCHLDWQVS